MISQQIIDSCQTIEEVLDIKTDNGKIKYASIGNDGQDYSSFVRRYQFLKERIKTDLPDFTLEEVLKFYEFAYKLNDCIYSFSGHEDYMPILEFEYKKGLL